ncbi:MAG: sulfur carrier protein ThiS [Deltaproteobacteria bacterium]|nr:sulfur carrier protein ThiS [Deltaproteobacteria bacterium]MBR5705208.1 sulfur carrier protein ThiS [Deltaproteobacteria bacterium]
MRIWINEEPQEVKEGVTLQSLLNELGFDAATVVVEMDGAIVARDAFATTTLSEGNRLELVRFVGGG